MLPYFFFARAPPSFLAASHRRLPLARATDLLTTQKENKRQSKIYRGKLIHLHFKTFYLVYYRLEDTNLELNFTFINPVRFNKANKLNHLSSRDVLFDFHRRQGDLPAIKEKITY